MADVTLICTVNPSLEIYDPADGSWTKFRGGRLDIADDDPHFGVVMEEASRNPAIAVYKGVKTCVHCGENFGSTAKLEKHVEAIHFDKWIADKDASHAESRDQLVKARSTYFVCDACRPPGEFQTEEELAAHVAILHTAAPDLGDAGTGGLGAEGSGGEREPVKQTTRRRRPGERRRRASSASKAAPKAESEPEPADTES